MKKSVHPLAKSGCLYLGFAVLALFLVAVPASAKESAKEKSLGAFGAWNAYAYNEGGQTVCYMVTTKTVKSSGPQKRSAPYLMITHRPVEGSTDVFSYGGGTLLDAKRGVKLSVGKASFDLFSVHDIAWARDALTDHRIAAALRANPQAQAKAAPAAKSAKPILDLFDLAGAPAAYRAIGKACGLPGDRPKKSSVRTQKSHPRTLPKS